MQLIRTALADDVDLIGAKAIFRRISFTLNLEFLNGILRQNYGWRVERRVGVDQTIERVVIRGRAAAVDADSITLALPHLALFSVGLDRAGTDEQQIHKIASVERQLVNLLLSHGLRDGRGVGVETDRA